MVSLEMTMLIFCSLGVDACHPRTPYMGEVYFPLLPHPPPQNTRKCLYT